MTASVFAWRLKPEILLLCAAAAALPLSASPRFVHVAASTRFVYVHSGEPASGLSIIEHAPQQEIRRLSTDEHGETPDLRPGSELTIRDSATKTILLKIAAGDPIPATVRTPELIRLTGTIQADAAARTGLIVQYGIGKRVTTIERLRQNYDRYSTVEGSENTFFGLELPKAPLYSLNATVDAEGRFTTDWFPAIDDPMIVAHNADRAIGIRDFTLPKSFRSGETFTLDPLPLTPTRTLALAYQAGPHPIAVDARVYLRDVEIDPQERDSVARLLSVLDYIDPRLFVFATGLRAYYFEPGDSAISGLPPFQQMQIRVKGALASQTVERTVRFTGNRADVAVSSAELFPRGATARLKGGVVVEDSYEPVKDAKVVYSCYPEKIEVTTDEEGEFGIPDACVNRDVTFFVTATDSVKPARFAPLQMRKTLQPKHGSQPVVLALPVGNIGRPARPASPRAAPQIGPEDHFEAEHERPHLAPLSSSPVGRMFHTSAVPAGAVYQDDPQYDEGPIVYVYKTSIFGDSVDNVVDATWESQFNSTINLTVSTTGTWRVLLAVSAFMVYANDAVDLTANTSKVVATTALPYIRFGSYLSVLEKNSSRPASNIAVYFASPAVDPDPTEIDTNELGVAKMGLLDTDTVHVFVRDESAGYFDCDVKLDFRLDATVFLLPTPNTPCPK